jgi:hypothetical protein
MKLNRAKTNTMKTNNTKAAAGLLLVIFLSLGLRGQNEGVSIKNSPSAPHASAMLDVGSSSKGLLIPHVSLSSLSSSSSPVSGPADGLLVYNTNTAVSTGSGFYYWSQDDLLWLKLSTGSELWKNISTTSDIYYDNATTHKVVIGSSSPTPTFNLEVRAAGSDNYACRFDATGDAQLRFGSLDLNTEAGTGPGSFLTQKSPTVDGGGGSYSARYTQLYSDNEVGLMITSFLKSYGSPGYTEFLTGGNDILIKTPNNLYAESVTQGAYAQLLSTGWTIISDSTMKKNISNENPVLEKIGLCRPVTYLMKNQPAGTPLNHGFLAQEIEVIFPELVSTISIRNPDGQGQPTVKKSLNVTEFVPILVKAIQEQQALINNLKTRVLALENQ